jgi:hypothetical protein
MPGMRATSTIVHFVSDVLHVRAVKILRDRVKRNPGVRIMKAIGQGVEYIEQHC